MGSGRLISISSEPHCVQNILIAFRILQASINKSIYPLGKRNEHRRHNLLPGPINDPLQRYVEPPQVVDCPEYVIGFSLKQRHLLGGLVKGGNHAVLEFKHAEVFH